jgi:hypothetical protein
LRKITAIKAINVALYVLSGRDRVTIRDSAVHWLNPYCEDRLARRLARVTPGIALCEHTDAAGELVFRQACAMGLEGIVSKQLAAPYRSGPSGDWIKVKNPDSPAMVRHRAGTLVTVSPAHEERPRPTWAGAKVLTLGRASTPNVLLQCAYRTFFADNPFAFANELTSMATKRLDYPIEPMDLANMRENGVRSLDVQCWQCRHRTIINADHWPGDLTVKSFEPRMVCTKCGTIGADVRPNWRERERP